MDMLVSIIIPTFNTGEYIGQCLDSLASLNYPKDKVEIIVVDNGSTDNTVEIVNKRKVKFLINQKGTISKSRNLGARRAQGSILAFIDGDCLAPHNWLEQAVKLLDREDINAVGCWYKLPSRPSLVEKIWDIHTSNRRMKSGYVDWIPSSNFIISKVSFEAINGFSDFLVTSEDVDICQRLRNKGMNVFSEPKLSAVHLANPKNTKDFFLKEIWRGKGVLQNFLCDFPRLKFNKAMVFAIATLVFVLTAIIGIGIWGIFGDKTLFSFSMAGLITIPLGLGIRAIALNKQWFYLFHLVFLFLVFGLSRALSLLNFRIWKDLSKAAERREFRP